MLMFFPALAKFIISLQALNDSHAKYPMLSSKRVNEVLLMASSAHLLGDAL